MVTAVYDKNVTPSADTACLSRRLLWCGGLGYNGRISLYSKVGNLTQSGKSQFVIFETLNQSFYTCTHSAFRCPTVTKMVLQSKYCYK